MAKTRTRRKQPRPSQPRASWKGTLTFGLVSFQVEAFNAISREGSDVHFHQLHVECHNRIQYQKTCPVHGEVTAEEIVSGYERSPGVYVEIDPDELDALRSPGQRAFKIDAFVAPHEIDPLYFDGRMYYLLPAGAVEAEPYRVLHHAMEQEEMYGVGQIVFQGKDQVALLRPVGDVLHMAMLNFAAEIRPPEKAASTLPSGRLPTRQVRLAKTLVRDWSVEGFDFGQYVDHYREEVQDLIRAKVRGKKLVSPAENEESEPATINLLDALKESIAQERPKSGRPKRRKRRSA